MDEPALRLLRVGLRQPNRRGRTAVLLVAVMLLSMMQPVSGDVTVARDDFGVLDAFADTLADRAAEGESLVAIQGAQSSFALLDASKRPVQSGDALADAENVLNQVELRDTTPFEEDHPRPYEFLTDVATHPDAWPYNLWETLFSVENLGLDNLLGIGINTYAVYVNFTSRNDGPAYEAWDKGTFTGELLVGTDLVLFMNYIDIDGDGTDDLSVGLTLEGLTTLGEGFGIETSNNPIPGVPGVPTELWIRPTFQWAVSALNINDPLWNELEHLEVSLMKGLAFDITLSNSESYAIVVDTRFTQPPADVTLGVGIERISFDITSAIALPQQFITSLLLGTVNSSDLALTGITAPYSVRLSNPNAPGGSQQTDCSETLNYDPATDYDASSREHKCGIGIGVGYVHFDEVQPDQSIDILEYAYLDVGFHPEEGETIIPSEVDLTLRNDNLGENTFDTIEIYSDVGTDVYIHYFEDRSNVPEGDSPFGNITDSRLWIRGLPSGSLHEDEIAAIFTTIGEAPGSVNLPGDIPDRLSLIIAIKNFSGDNTNNVNDPTLPINPAQPPNTLFLIAGTSSIKEFNYASSFKRGGYSGDSSSMLVEMEDLPRVIVIQGSFLLSSSGVNRVNFDNPNLNTIAQFFDNALLTVVEIILDIGTILNGLPSAVVGTAGSTGGAIDIQCYNQVKKSLPSSNRESMEIEHLLFALASSPQPWLPEMDHILLSEDTNIAMVDGRLGPVDPLVPVAMSMRIGGISHVRHAFDPINEIRDMQLDGSASGSLLIGHIKHDDGDLDNAIKQSAMVSNRPAQFNILQQAESLEYQASEPIGTITYGGQSGEQRNAIRLSGLPASFKLVLGDTVGYVADGPMESIQVQMTNASTPLTMDGDHVRFWVNEDTAEASLSLKLSDITSIERLSPLVPGSLGPEGNSEVRLVRSSSSPFGVSFEDESTHDNPFLGLNGKVYFDPLPANISLTLPSDVDSDGLELPTFGEEEGIEALSFFLGDLVDFGSVVNDFVHALTVNVGGDIGESENMSLGLDLFTGEAFNMTVDLKKGSNLEAEPAWMHGLGMEALEQTRLESNLSRMPAFTATSRGPMEDILADGRIDESERVQALTILEAINITAAEALVNALEDGRVTDAEMVDVNMTQLAEEGLTLHDTRAWHLRAWLPSLPAGTIELVYDFRMLGGIPTYEVDLKMSQWQPMYPQMTIIANGLEGRDLELFIDGLDTTTPRNVEVNALFSTQENLTVPRVSVDMHYDAGVRLKSAHAILIDHEALTRVEALVVGIPQSTDVSAVIGDVLILTLVVPEVHRINGHSADSLMLKQLRYVDGFWYPSTAFMRDLPGEMNLATEPDTRFDIRKQTAFQGMRTLDYSSNTDDMDLYLEASGRAIEAKGDVLMLAEDLPTRFVLSLTDDFGMRVDSSGSGVKKVYVRQTDVPATPGVTIERVEVVGQNLKGATIRIYSGPGEYPLIVIDDITDGRLVATAEAYVQPGLVEPWVKPIFGEFEMEGRAVLLDAQFTGIIPTASSVGVNGIVTDLSLVGSFTGEFVETRHVMVIDPIGSALASGLAMLFG
ncbi:MAG TPA: hypothetical protein D7H92_06215 [Candidatus Poseidoniales archaeon]|nr:MAG TPA: hypothetical protein D7H92_06215 [Candidatus Poseidoniales archaeon]